MRKIYLAFIPVTILIMAACSKDVFKSYDKRIMGGTWELYDISSVGVGSRYSPAFYNGWFTFEESGRATYTNQAGEVYEGSWDIRKDYQQDNLTQSLFITVINFQTQDVLSEYFDDMQFTGTDRFKAFINSGTRTYTCKFKR